MEIITNRVRAFIKYNGEDCEIDYDEGHLSIYFGSDVTFDQLREWIELLEDASKPAKRDPVWVRRKRAADFYGVSTSCVALWAKQGRIRRHATPMFHGPTGARIYMYDISSAEVPPKGTFEVADVTQA